MTRAVRAAAVVLGLLAALLLPGAAGQAAAAPVAPFAEHLTVGFVFGDDGYDTNPFWRGEFGATTVRSRSVSGPFYWQTRTTVLTGQGRVARINMPDTARQGVVTLTVVQRPLQPAEVSVSAFDGWLTGRSTTSGADGFAGTFRTSDGHSGPIAALNDAMLGRPAQRTAAEYPFLATVLSGPHAGVPVVGDFHVNQVDTLVGGNFLSSGGIHTVIGDTDGHLVLMHLRDYGAVVGIPDTVLGARVLGGTFTGPAAGDGGVWGSVRTFHLF